MRDKYIYRILCVFSLSVLISLLLPGIVLTEEQNLNGRTYVGVMRKLGTWKKHKVEITFVDNKFILTSCDAFHYKIISCDLMGFPETPYFSNYNADIIDFRAVTRLLKEGYMRWEGVVEGEELNTCLSWHRRKRATKAYCFSGILKK